MPPLTLHRDAAAQQSRQETIEFVGRWRAATSNTAD
jgi:hypothetical protein